MRRWGQAANPLWPTETPSSAGGRSSRNRSSEDVPDAGLEMVQVHVEGDAGVGVGAGREQRPAPVEMGGRHRVRRGEDEQEGADMEEDADLEAFRLPTPKVLLGTDAPKDINGESSSNFSVDDSEPLMQRNNQDEEWSDEEDEDEYAQDDLLGGRTPRRSCWKRMKRKMSKWWRRVKSRLRKKRVYHPRRICFSKRLEARLQQEEAANQKDDSRKKPAGPTKYCDNKVRNNKYTLLTFLPKTLYEEFRFFFNLYFLVVALSQFFPPLKVGFLFTYIGPLAFVLAVSLTKEAYDDIKRWRRDSKMNHEKYELVTSDGIHTVCRSDLKVGDFVHIHPNQTVPADCVLLHTTEKSGASFIRTDQLDGETDWKLRHALRITQRLEDLSTLHEMDISVFVEAPRKDIYDFVGRVSFYPGVGENTRQVESLSTENTLWADTVVASGTVTGVVIYTGRETRAAMNASTPKNKTGLLDLEINRLSKFLCVILVGLSIVLVLLKGLHGNWIIYMFRFILLFSSIIPISLRVNLDMGKTLYSILIMRDKAIPETVVRNSSIPEELGRINYILTDKTGTLTKNEMIFKKLHLGDMVFSKESLGDIARLVGSYYSRRGEGGGGGCGLTQ